MIGSDKFVYIFRSFCEYVKTSIFLDRGWTVDKGSLSGQIRCHSVNERERWGTERKRERERK